MEEFLIGLFLLLQSLIYWNRDVKEKSLEENLWDLHHFNISHHASSHCSGQAPVNSKVVTVKTLPLPASQSWNRLEHRLDYATCVRCVVTVMVNFWLVFLT